MPFDSPFPIPVRSRTRPVAFWLFGMAGMILVMVTLGGATRLTGSGLSIMEWAPLMGTLPPLSDAEWHRLYTLYQQIPQYVQVNHGFGLDGFKGIFWLEWTHRLWGRLMGVAFLVPLIVFTVQGRLRGGLAWRLMGLLALGGMQGLVGWLMVSSGFEADRLAVSPYRLVAHLALAVTLYAAILWTALGLWSQGRAGISRVSHRMAALTCTFVAITILAGGFVAGLKAGLTYNSFPLMDGRLVPEGYGTLHPMYINLFENVAAVQFDHRLLATITAVLATATVLVGLRRGGPRTALVSLGAAVLMQYALGVVTLLWAVPLALGTAHQTVAIILLTAALVVLHGSRGQPAVPVRA